MASLCSLEIAVLSLYVFPIHMSYVCYSYIASCCIVIKHFKYEHLDVLKSSDSLEAISE